MQLGSDKDISLNDRMSSELDLSLFMIQGIMTPARIKKIRKKYGLIQSDFADMISVSYNTYISWESGARNPSTPSCALLQIAEKHPAIFLQNRRELIESVMKYFGKNK